MSPSRALQLEEEVFQFTESIFSVLTDDRDRDREVKETLRSVDFLEGRHWREGQRAQRNRPVLNKVKRHFWDQVGLLTDLSLDYYVKMFNKLESYSEFETILNQLSVRWAQSNDVKFQDRFYDVTLYGLLHTGPSKVQWNSQLMNGMGDVEIVPIAPWQWGTLGAGSDPQQSECILFFPVVTRDHIQRKYGRQLASRIECDMEMSGAALSGQFKRPSHIDKGSWSRMGEGLRVSLGVKRSTLGNDSVYPMCMLKEYWLRDNSVNESSRTVTVGNDAYNWAYQVEPGEFLYPRGRVIVTAGGVVLEDSPNPYWHAKFPFSTFRPFRVPWQMSGTPVCRSWIQMNQVINTLMGGMLDCIRSINEPTLIGPKGAFPSADWDALDPGAPGGKIKYANNAPRAPEFAKKADYPIAAVMQTVDLISKELDASSGAAAMTAALGKKQVPGGDSLEMIMDSRSLPVKIESKALANYVEDAGWMVVSDMLQFYSVAHRVNILGPKGISSADWRPVYGSAKPVGMKSEDFVRQFQGIVRRDTLLQSQKRDKVQYAIALAKMGKLSDEMLFSILDPDGAIDFQANKRQLIEETILKMKLQGAAAAMQGAAKGGGGKGKK
jgi:hypothetical protein